MSRRGGGFWSWCAGRVVRNTKRLWLINVVNYSERRDNSDMTRERFYYRFGIDFKSKTDGRGGTYVFISFANITYKYIYIYICIQIVMMIKIDYTRWYKKIKQIDFINKLLRIIIAKYHIQLIIKAVFALISTCLIHSAF